MRSLQPLHYLYNTFEVKTAWFLCDAKCGTLDLVALSLSLFLSASFSGVFSQIDSAACYYSMLFLT